MDKSKLALLLAGVALLVGGLGLVLPGQPSVQIVKEIVTKLGAFPGADFGDCISRNGIRECILVTPIDTASSTLCVINMNQIGATSTLLNFTAHITTSATGAWLGVLEGNRPNFFAPALSVATSANVIGSVQLAGTLATGTAISHNATSSLDANGVHILGASSSLVFFAKAGDAGSINQGGTGRVVGGRCIATVQAVN